MYTLEKTCGEISVQEFMEKHMDVEKFLTYCRQCKNYNKKWTCPSNDFDPVEFWQKYSTLKLEGTKIILSPEVRDKDYTREEMRELVEKIITAVRRDLDKHTYQWEQENPGSYALYAGSCRLCGSGVGRCTRGQGLPCRMPERARHAIESLGGNVMSLAEDVLHIEMKWAEAKLPEYFLLVSGLACK